MLLLAGWTPGRAQSLEGQALAYDTVLAAASRRGEITQRLHYRETVTPATPGGITVVFVHHRQDGWYTKVFRVRLHQADSLVAYPEQLVTNPRVRRTFTQYFEQVRRYPEFRRTEYQGTDTVPVEQPPQPPAPKWVIRVVEVGPGKRPFVAFFHRMDPASHSVAEAPLIKRINRHFARLQKALRTHAQQHHMLLTFSFPRKDFLRFPGPSADLVAGPSAPNVYGRQ